jgi:hypothetical protein
MLITCNTQSHVLCLCAALGLQAGPEACTISFHTGCRCMTFDPKVLLFVCVSRMACCCCLAGSARRLSTYQT